MANYKVQRLAADIVQVVSNVLANEASDSLLKTITITGCEVTNDLSYAKIYFTSLSALSVEQLEKELAEAAGYIRKEVANNLEIRHTPELKFIFDKSIEYGNKIESIIKKIHE